MPAVDLVVVVAVLGHQRSPDAFHLVCHWALGQRPGPGLLPEQVRRPSRRPPFCRPSGPRSSPPSSRSPASHIDSVRRGSAPRPGSFRLQRERRAIPHRDVENARPRMKRIRSVTWQFSAAVTLPPAASKATFDTRLGKCKPFKMAQAISALSRRRRDAPGRRRRCGSSGHRRGPYPGLQ